MSRNKKQSFVQIPGEEPYSMHIWQFGFQSPFFPALLSEEKQSIFNQLLTRNILETGFELIPFQVANADVPYLTKYFSLTVLCFSFLPYNLI